MKVMHDAVSHRRRLTFQKAGLISTCTVAEGNMWLEENSDWQEKKNNQASLLLLIREGYCAVCDAEND